MTDFSPSCTNNYYGSQFKSVPIIFTSIPELLPLPMITHLSILSFLLGTGSRASEADGGSDSQQTEDSGTGG